MKALTSVLLETVPGKAGFEEFEKLLFEVSNEVERQILSRRLEVIANRYDTDCILVDGQRYKRHELGEVEYHSLCGSMKISRYTYRRQFQWRSGCADRTSETFRSSGATEGACKSLIMIRTKGCDQRWHSRGVNAVLALRGLYLSDRLHRFWAAMSKRSEVNIQVAA